MKLAWLVYQSIWEAYLLVYSFSKEEALELGYQYLQPQDEHKPFYAVREPFSDQYAVQGKDIELDETKRRIAWLGITNS